MRFVLGCSSAVAVLACLQRGDGFAPLAGGAVGRRGVRVEQTPSTPTRKSRQPPAYKRQGKVPRPRSAAPARRTRRPRRSRAARRRPSAAAAAEATSHARGRGRARRPRPRRADSTPPQYLAGSLFDDALQASPSDVVQWQRVSGDQQALREQGEDYWIDPDALAKANAPRAPAQAQAAGGGPDLEGACARSSPSRTRRTGARRSRSACSRRSRSAGSSRACSKSRHARSPTARSRARARARRRRGDAAARASAGRRAAVCAGAADSGAAAAFRVPSRRSLPFAGRAASRPELRVFCARWNSQPSSWRA